MLPLLSATFLPFRSATDLSGESFGTTIASASGAGGSLADVDEVGAGGLRKDRRRLADGAEVDRADVQAFEQLRAGRELGPLDLDALRREALLELPRAFSRVSVPYFW